MQGDILLHCGDFSMGGGLDEIKSFNEWSALVGHWFCGCLVMVVLPS